MDGDPVEERDILKVAESIKDFRVQDAIADAFYVVPFEDGLYKLVPKRLIGINEKEIS